MGFYCLLFNRAAQWHQCCELLVDDKISPCLGQRESHQYDDQDDDDGLNSILSSYVVY